MQNAIMFIIVFLKKTAKVFQCSTAKLTKLLKNEKILNKFVKLNKLLCNCVSTESINQDKSPNFDQQYKNCEHSQKNQENF